MVEVKNKAIIKFEITSKEESESVLPEAFSALLNSHATLYGSTYQMMFTDINDSLISKIKIRQTLSSFKKIISANSEWSFTWINTNSEEPCIALDLYEDVYDFFLDIFFNENVKMPDEVFFGLGNHKIASHLIQNESQLITPDGIFDRSAVNSCQVTFRYHEDWDWIMSAWEKLREIAFSKGIMINKQIDDIFGVSIQVFNSDETFVQFDNIEGNGIKSLWYSAIKYILWFEEEMKKRL